MSNKVEQYLSSKVGDDNKVSPADWGAAKSAWMEDGGNPTVFDTKFSGYKNPNNSYYN